MECGLVEFCVFLHPLGLDRSLEFDGAMLLAWGTEQTQTTANQLCDFKQVAYSLRPNFLSCEMRIILYRAAVDMK